MRAKNRKQNFLFILLLRKREIIDQSSSLYNIKAPFELVHVDVADIRVFSKSAVDPKYCLLAVDLFTSKMYVYPMKSRKQKLENWNFSIEIFSLKENRL